MTVAEISMSGSRCARSILMFATLDILALAKTVSFHLSTWNEVREEAMEDFYEFSEGFKRR
jgi:hypothetical protein